MSNDVTCSHCNLEYDGDEDHECSPGDVAENAENVARMMVDKLRADIVSVLREAAGKGAVVSDVALVIAAAELSALGDE